MKLTPSCQACGQPIENDTARQAYARFEQQKNAFEAKALADAKAKVEAEQKAALATARHEGRQAAEAQLAEANRKNEALQTSLDERLAAGIKVAIEAKDRERAEADSKRNTEREHDLKTIEKLQRQLQEISTTERKKQAQENLLETLRAAFPNDKLHMIKDGANGADILHTVINDDHEECGSILWESKDRGDWQTAWVTKLEKDQEREGSNHAVLVTAFMPAKANGLPVHLIGDIYITRPENVIATGVHLRRDLIKRAAEPEIDIDGDHAELLKYMIGDGQKHLDAWNELNNKSRVLTTAMKNAHQRVENARKEHDALQEAEYLEMQAELDEITRRNKRDDDEN